MPKALLERLQPDCIGEFRAAAQQRFMDALALAAAGRRTGSIYLCGYSAEMVLKSAYFTLAGFSDRQTVTNADLKGAKDYATKTLGMAWTGNFHDLAKWAELLVTRRAVSPALAYAMPGFGTQVVHESRSLQRIWKENLRYHKNVAYAYELNRARAATEWLLANSLLL